MKTLQSNFTTPEQSKRLMELGVPVDSADMKYWEGHSITDRDIPILLTPSLPYSKSNMELYHLPCWSVGRLMEIIRICNLTDEKPWVHIEQDNIRAMITAITDGVNNYMLDFSKLEG